jgi:hypothetical protein
MAVNQQARGRRAPESRAQRRPPGGDHRRQGGGVAHGQETGQGHRLDGLDDHHRDEGREDVVAGSKARLAWRKQLALSANNAPDRGRQAAPRRMTTSPLGQVRAARPADATRPPAQVSALM